MGAVLKRAAAVAVPGTTLAWLLSSLARSGSYSALGLAVGAPVGIGQGAANGLLNNLIAYWPGDEASGNLLDAHTNGLDLTDNNTVTSNPGHVYTTARQYTLANSEYHSRADEALLRVGNNDATFAVWVYLDSKPADKMGIVSKDNDNDPGRDYRLDWDNNSDRFRFIVFDVSNNVVGLVSADNLGAPSLSTWYLVQAWLDVTANKVYISVNNGTADSAALSGTPGTSTASFCIGSYEVTLTPRLFNGRIGPTAFWKSAAGGGGVLTAAQRAALWNDGAGLKYSEFTS